MIDKQTCRCNANDHNTENNAQPCKFSPCWHRDIIFFEVVEASGDVLLVDLVVVKVYFLSKEYARKDK